MADKETRRAARRAALVAVPAALLAGLIAFWALGGFNRDSTRPGPTGSGATTPGGVRSHPTTPVSVPAPSLGQDQAAVCAALVAQLPATVRDLARREVAAGPEQNAAYGEPPLALACGAATPSIAPDATVYQLSGVCWYAAQDSAGSTWTTVDRTVPVSVTVPRTYQAPGQWVIEFSGPILATVPASASSPAGCRG